MALAPWCPRLVIGKEWRPDPRQAAADWLAARQSPDGAWRSDTYGSFRDGRALTPMVLRAMSTVDHDSAPCRRACAWLLEKGEALFEEYPVHLASAVLEAARRLPALAPLTTVALERLESLQCQVSGGWSYSPLPPPRTGGEAPMQEANLSATAMAIDGLCACGGDFRKALAFIHGCQNHATGDNVFDDGGFFQMSGDPTRNKAGRAGKDRKGTERFHSYASATADGLRALLLCGENPGSPRVLAAADWLRRFRWTPLGGKNAPADLIYYTARSIAATRKLIAGIPSPAALIESEHTPDGSWRNPAGEMREDCPVVATALALEALGNPGK
ncbi:MAG: hypothetical protein RLZZ505_1857 [Verrucomicrobiota bacterium]|jgi:hypothetical protein